MIDFACKKFDINEVIRCGLSLTKTEFVILMSLIKHNKYVTTINLAKLLKLDLTTVQRAMKKFYVKNIVTRSQENLENGGYVFVYKIHEKDKIRQEINKIINNWNEHAKREINNW